MRAAEAVGLAQSTKRTLFLHIESDSDDSDTPPAPASLFEGVRGNVGDEARAVIARGIVCTLTKKSTDFEMLTSAYPEIGEPEGCSHLVMIGAGGELLLSSDLKSEEEVCRKVVEADKSLGQEEETSGKAAPAVESVPMAEAVKEREEDRPSVSAEEKPTKVEVDVPPRKEEKVVTQQQQQKKRQKKQKKEKEKEIDEEEVKLVMMSQQRELEELRRRRHEQWRREADTEVKQAEGGESGLVDFLSTLFSSLLSFLSSIFSWISPSASASSQQAPHAAESEQTSSPDQAGKVKRKKTSDDDQQYWNGNSTQYLPSKKDQ